MMNLDLQKVLPAEAFETEQNEGDYIGKDGLLYCGVCRTKKQTRLPVSDFTGGREMIVPCICKCKVEENKRKEEEEKKRQEMQRLERLKASSLMDEKLKAARLDGYQVDGDNQKIYNLAGNYVKRFDEMYEKRQGLLFWGTVCKCQYKIVGFLSYKNVGKPTRLYDILCNLIFLNHILHLIL